MSRIKKVLLILASLYGAYIFATYIYFSAQPVSADYCPVALPGYKQPSLEDPDDAKHTYKLINDASCLNETRVYDVVVVKTVDDIAKAITKAKEKKLKISVAGVRHSMGGQAFFKDALVLDMRDFNRIISLDEQNKILTVESGATWHQIQLYLHPKNLAVKAMQSTDIFTVGGSLSVNAHGMDHNVGSVASTVRSFTIMLADGTIQRVTKGENPELFRAVIGGYGLFGVILEVSLEVTKNVLYERDATSIDYKEFPAFFERVSRDKNYGLFYAHLSSSPIDFFEDMIIYGYKEVPHAGPFNPLGKVSLVSWRRYLINLAKVRSYARFFKWIAEKYIDPAIDAIRKNSLLSRNEVMHDSVEYLENVLINETDILQEYFIPRKYFVPCIDKMRQVLGQSGIPVLNASVRVVHKEDSMLNYAPRDMFAIVLYLNQEVTYADIAVMQKLTQDLVDVVLSFNGTFFLPYQLSFTKDQLRRAYPNIDEFFELKRKYDPGLLFMNGLYAKYATA